MTSLSGVFSVQQFSDAGDPLVGGRVYTYVQGTTTHKNAYTDAAGLIPHSYTSDGAGGLYVALNARGELPGSMYLADGAYDITLRRADGSTVWTRRADPTHDAADTLRDDLADQADDVLGAGLVGFSASLDYPDKTVGQRIHRDYINVGDIGGTDPTGTVDNTAKVLAAIATGKLVRLDGFYRVSTTLTNPLVGIVGDGARKSGLIVNGVHAITFTSDAGLDRRAARLEDFAIDSLANSCDSKFAIYAPGVAASAAAVYNSGLYAGGLCIGRNSRMGGFAYVKDFFGAVFEDITGTDLSRGVQFVGSVVQCEVRNFKANNDNAATALSRYGLSTETATYDTGVMAPENLSVSGLKFIRCARGINHAAGLFVTFRGLDTEADEYGAHLNAECKLEASLVAPGVDAVAWTGILVGVAPATPDAGIWLEDIDINTLRAPGDPTLSFGVDIGNGADPVMMADLLKMRFRGEDNSLQTFIRARGCRSLRISRAVMRATASIGDVINANGRRLTIEDNCVTDENGDTAGTITLSDGGNATDAGRIVNNQSSALAFTPTTRGNWEIRGNDGVKRWNAGAVVIADGGSISHGLSAEPTRIMLTTSTSAEFASVAANGASSFVVAIKKDTGAPGTTATVFWEAEY